MVFVKWIFLASFILYLGFIEKFRNALGIFDTSYLPIFDKLFIENFDILHPKYFFSDHIFNYFQAQLHI